HTELAMIEEADRGRVKHGGPAAHEPLGPTSTPLAVRGRAHGRRAGALQAVGAGCAPAVSSAPNGMWCRRRTKGFMSPRASVSEATPSRFLEERASSLRERAQSAQRHLRPLRAARELAPQIAERGIELEQREGRCHLLERCVQTRPARDLVVGREEYTA